MLYNPRISSSSLLNEILEQGSKPEHSPFANSSNFRAGCWFGISSAPWASRMVKEKLKRVRGVNKKPLEKGFCCWDITIEQISNKNWIFLK